MNVEEATILLRFDGAAATNGIRDTKKALNDLTRGATDYGRQLDASLSNVAKVTAELQVVGRGIATAFNTAMALPNLVNDTAEATRNMGQFAQNVGMSAEKIKALQQLMGQLGGTEAGTNAFIQDIARRKSQLASGLGNLHTLMPNEFYAAGGNPEKVLRGTQEDAIKEYARVYESIIKGQKGQGKTDIESEAYASQQMLFMVNEDMLQVLKLGTAEIQKQIDLEAQRAPVITPEDLKNSIEFTRNWQHIIQSIENAKTVTMRNLTNLGAENVKDTAGYVDNLLKNSSKSWERMTHPMERLRELFNNPRSVLLQDLKEIGETLPFLERIYEWLAKISGISLDNIKNPVTAITYDAMPQTWQEKTQNAVGETAAWLGIPEAVQAREVLENADKYGSTLSKQEKIRVAMDYFVKQGRTVDQAAGMVANIEAESGGMSVDVVSGKRRGDSGSAYGVGQWRGDRQTHFQSLYGKPMQGSSLMEQLRYYNDEFGAYETGADKKLRQSKSAYEAGANVSRYFERPADEAGQAHSRGSRAENLAAAYKASQQGPAMPAPVDTKALVQPTTQPQGASVTINVEQTIKSTDPEQAGKESATAIENLHKSAAFQSGMH